jgi:hypothetical protein
MIRDSKNDLGHGLLAFPMMGYIADTIGAALLSASNLSA